MSLLFYFTYQISARSLRIDTPQAPLKGGISHREKKILDQGNCLLEAVRRFGTIGVLRKIINTCLISGLRSGFKGGIRSIEKLILDRRDYPLEAVRRFGIIGVFIKETAL